MKNNYTTFIADIVVKDNTAIRKVTTVVYKTDCNKFFVSKLNDGITSLSEIKKGYILHVYG